VLGVFLLSESTSNPTRGHLQMMPWLNNRLYLCRFSLQRWKPSNYCTLHGGARERQLVRKGGYVLAHIFRACLVYRNDFGLFYSEAPCAGFRRFKVALTGPNANGGTEIYCSGFEVCGHTCMDQSPHLHSLLMYCFVVDENVAAVWHCVFMHSVHGNRRSSKVGRGQGK